MSLYKELHFRVVSDTEIITSDFVGTMQAILTLLDKKDYLKNSLRQQYCIVNELGAEELFDSYFNSFLDQLNKKYGTFFDVNKSYTQVGPSIIKFTQPFDLELFNNKESSNEGQKQEEDLQDPIIDCAQTVEQEDLSETPTGSSPFVGRTVLDTDRESAGRGQPVVEETIETNQESETEVVSIRTIRTDYESIHWDKIKPPRWSKQNVVDLAGEFGIILDDPTAKLVNLVEQFKKQIRSRVTW